MGVASLTLDRTLAPAQAAGDIGRLVDRPGLDIVGWQGSARFGAELRALPGWGTRRVTSGDRGTSLAVSWRRERLVLVDAGLRQAGRRTLATVTLRHRGTGRLITVVDAHLPEQLAEGGTPGRRAPGRWVLGTAGDVTGRTGDAQRIDGTSYLVLGTSPDARLVPTFRPEGRRVAVVYVDRGAHRDGRLRFAGRWVVRGFAGDHDALVARLVLS
ncbi:MAG TPA: hypothetical protein VD864_15040 [Nocardioides sp.]|nr:hypothetical protein [Nocardioides sp.]